MKPTVRSQELLLSLLPPVNLPPSSTGQLSAGFPPKALPAFSSSHTTGSLSPEEANFPWQELLGGQGEGGFVPHLNQCMAMSSLFSTPAPGCETR